MESTTLIASVRVLLTSCRPVARLWILGVRDSSALAAAAASRKPWRYLIVLGVSADEV